MFPYIGNNHPNWISCFSEVFFTTNQDKLFVQHMLSIPKLTIGFKPTLGRHCVVLWKEVKWDRLEAWYLALVTCGTYFLVSNNASGPNPFFAPFTSKIIPGGPWFGPLPGGSPAIPPSIWGRLLANAMGYLEGSSTESFWGYVYIYIITIDYIYNYLYKYMCIYI